MRSGIDFSVRMKFEELTQDKLLTYGLGIVVLVLILLWQQNVSLNSSKTKRRKTKPVRKRDGTFNQDEIKFIRMMSKSYNKEPDFEAEVDFIDVNAYGFFIDEFSEKTNVTYSLLMYASHYFNCEALKVLLENGADVMWRNNRGQTVLDLFARRGQNKLAEICLKFSGTQIEKETLQKAAQKVAEAPEFGQAEEDFLQLMLDNVVDKKQLSEVAEDINPNSVTFYKLPDDKITETTYSLLMYASHQNNYEAFEILLEKGANPQWRNNRKATVLQLIAKRGQLMFAKRCKDFVSPEDWHFFINQGNRDGWTPLHAAIQNKRYLFTDWLLENKANPNAKMLKTNWTPLHITAKMLDTKAKASLMQKGADHSVQANHRHFGRNACPRDIQDLASSQLRDEVSLQHNRMHAIDMHREASRKHGKRVLLVLASVVEFADAGSRREGAEMDQLLTEVMRKKVDCQIITLNDYQGNFRTMIQAAQYFMNNDPSLGIVFFVVSSHGGINEYGEYFKDSSGDTFFIKEDLKDQFSIDCCPGMESKYAVFFINTCRTVSQDPEDVKIKPSEKPISKEACSITVRPCSSGNVSYRHIEKGSVGILVFKQTLENYGAKISVQELFRKTQSELLDKYKVKHDRNIIFPRLEINDNILHDIYFKERQ